MRSIVVQILLYLQAHESIVISIYGDDYRSHDKVNLIICKVNFLSLFVNWLDVIFEQY